MRKLLHGILVLSYLLGIAFYALRPFKPIFGLGYADAIPEYEDGAVHIRTGAALEDRHNASSMRKELMKSGEMSLVVSLRTDSLSRFQFGRIFAYARDCMGLNFALIQKGNGISFLLRTTSPENNGLPYELLVPAILNTNRWQQLVMTYDGSRTRLFADGKLRGEHSGSSGTFSNWGRNHALVIGDEPAGGQPWSGRIRRVAIHDRALDDQEIAELAQGGTVPDAILEYKFRTENEQACSRSNGLGRLRYRNLFITADSAESQMTDSIANVLGFLPLGFFIYLALPQRIERRKILASILIPALVGFMVSGGIEWAQRYILLRVPSALDVVNNVTGTLLGGLFAWLVNSTYEKR